MNLAAMLVMAFTCRTNPSDRVRASSLKQFIRQRLLEMGVSTTSLECKWDTGGRKRKGGLGVKLSYHALWFELQRGSKKRNLAGWVARTRPLAEPLSPRGPQPVLRRLRT